MDDTLCAAFTSTVAFSYAATQQQTTGVATGCRCTAADLTHHRLLCLKFCLPFTIYPLTWDQNGKKERTTPNDSALLLDLVCRRLGSGGAASTDTSDSSSTGSNTPVSVDILLLCGEKIYFDLQSLRDEGEEWSDCSTEAAVGEEAAAAWASPLHYVGCYVSSSFAHASSSADDSSTLISLYDLLFPSSSSEELSVPMIQGEGKEPTTTVDDTTAPPAAALLRFPIMDDFARMSLKEYAQGLLADSDRLEEYYRVYRDPYCYPPTNNNNKNNNNRGELDDCTVAGATSFAFAQNDAWRPKHVFRKTDKGGETSWCVEWGRLGTVLYFLDPMRRVCCYIHPVIANILKSYSIQPIENSLGVLQGDDRTLERICERALSEINRWQDAATATATAPCNNDHEN